MADNASLYLHLNTLAEPIRARALRLLAREELTVGEVAQVLQLPQSTISRHLKRLETRGWITRRSSGTANLASMDPEALPEGAAALWAVVEERMEGEHEEDLRRLEHILSLREVDSAEFFGRHAASWDALRRELYGDAFLLPTLLSLLPAGQVIADLGCGTGAVVEILAPVAGEVLGVDREEAMLEVARRRCEGLDNVRLEQGLLSALPVKDGALDLALCTLVLHHVAAPGPVFSEVARALRPGGRFVLLDMVEHGREAYRRSMGHRHLGFSRGRIEALGEEAGLALRSWRVLPPDPEARGPGLFVGVLGAG